jgi:hypothetical protein
MASRNDWLDTSLYPDVEQPVEVHTSAERVDFVARLCAAWDFGVVALCADSGRDPAQRVAPGGGCLPLADFARVSLAAGMARSTFPTFPRQRGRLPPR